MEGIQEAKNVALRMAQSTRKHQYAWLSTLSSTDNLLSSAYEYMTTFFTLRKAVEGHDVTETIQLHTQQALCKFGNSYFALLLEASRRGEKPLSELNDPDGLMQVVFRFVLAVIQISFSEEARPGIEHELTRILSKADFTIEHDVELFLTRKQASRSAKEMYREAMVAFGCRLSSPDLPPLAKQVRDAVGDLLQAEKVGIFLVDEKRGILWDEEKGATPDTTMFIASAGIIGSSVLTKASINCWDVQHDSRANMAIDSTGPTPTRSCLAIPLLLPPDGPDGEPMRFGCMGVLYISNKKPPNLPRFSEEDQSFIGMLAPVLAQALHNAREAARVGAQNKLYKQQIRVVNAIATAMTVKTLSNQPNQRRSNLPQTAMIGKMAQQPNVASVRTLGSHVAEVVRKEVGATAVSFFMVDHENDKIWRAGSAGGAPGARPESRTGDRKDEQRYEFEQGIVGKVINEGETVVVSDLRTCAFFDPSVDAEEMTIMPKDIICVPFRRMENLMALRAAEEDLVQEELALEEERAQLNLLRSTLRENNPRRIKMEAGMQKLQNEFAVSQNHVHRLAKMGVLGCLHLVNKMDGSTFQPNDKEFLNGIEDGISGAVAAMEAKELAEGKATYNGNIAGICEKLTSVGDQLPLHSIVEELKRVIDCEETMVFVPDTTYPNSLLRVASNPQNEIKEEVIDLAELEGKTSLVLQCYSAGQLFNIEDAGTSNHFNRKVDRSTLSEVDSNTMLVAPFFGKDGRVLGVIGGVNKRLGRAFQSREELRMLQLARIVGTVITNQSDYVQIHERARTATVLTKSICQMTGSLSLKDVIPQVLAGAKEIVCADHIHLFLPHRDGIGNSCIKLSASSNDTKMGQHIQLTGKNDSKGSLDKGWGFPGHCCTTKRPINLAGDAVTHDSRYCLSVDSMIGYEPAGMLVVPLIDATTAKPIFYEKGAKKQEDLDLPTLGCIQVVNEHMSKRKFTPKDVEALQAYVKVVAITIQNALIHDVDKEECDGIRATSERLDASRSLGFELHMSKMLQNVCDTTKLTMQAKQVALYILDQETRDNEPAEQVLVRHGLDQEAGSLAYQCGMEKEIQTFVGKGFIGLAALKRKVICSNNPVEDDLCDYFYDQPIHGATEETLPSGIVCAPCYDAEDRINGVIHVLRDEHGEDRKGFNLGHEDTMARLGLMVGACIDNSNRYTWLHDGHDFQVKLMECLHRITEVVGRPKPPATPRGSDDESESVYSDSVSPSPSPRSPRKPPPDPEHDNDFLKEEFVSLLLQEAKGLFEASTACLFVLNNDTGHVFRYELDAMFDAGLAGEPTRSMVPPWGIIGEAINAKAPMLIQDVNEYRKKGATEPVFQPEADCPTKLADCRNLMIAPIRGIVREDEGSPAASAAQEGYTLVGAISVVLDAEAVATGRKFTLGDQRVLELLCSHVTSIIYGGKYRKGLELLLPSEAEVDVMLAEVCTLPPETLLITEDMIMEKIKQLTMEQGILTASKARIGLHVSKALKLTNEWRMGDLVSWFDDTKEAFYNA